MTDQERIGGKDIFWLFAYSTLIGAMLVAFTMIPTFWRFLFSLGALFAGIRFFARYERIAMRVWLFILSFVYFILFTIVLVMILYSTGRIAPAD
ncbi:Putative uncharacterized protein [Thermobacillus xylanilyticus]|uniref:Uncharacterized protein n=1 Tax=Thermobacillus xylanilyticus TaxID=76633 RepID=A0ABM8V3S1_THEXY|nr:hypothetical protein [Thermobacillus xylanilyticus]CAG5085690.1 Putative uncharacterized protein [Thermobacillus xylanilyticus]